MTENAKHEAPLTWKSFSEWGSVGNTHRARLDLDNGDFWLFAVDQPRKGYWAVRGWLYANGSRSGDMRFYREDRTMKGGKAQAQAHANLAKTSTCGECGHIAGHKLDCSVGEDVAREQMRGQRLGLRQYVDRYSVPADTIQPQIASLQQMVDASRAAAVAMSGMLSRINVGLWINVRRPAGCTCPTPTHRMSCGHGARPDVKRKSIVVPVDDPIQLVGLMAQAVSNGVVLVDEAAEILGDA